MQSQRILEITTNVGCRLSCSYCPQATVTKAYHQQSKKSEQPLQCMTLSAFKKYISTVPKEVDFHFSGFSEPWYASECTDMIEAVHFKGHRIAIFTTTDGMLTEHINRLKLISFKRFVIHLPDGNDDMHLVPDAIYLERLQKLLHAIPNIEIVTIGIPNPDIVALLGQTNSTRRVHTRAGNIQLTSSAIGAAFTQEEILQRNSHTSLICRSNRMVSNVLLPNGNLQLCCMDYGLEHVLGNLSNESYCEIIEGKAFARIFDLLGQQHSEILCRRCEYAIPGSYTYFAK
jgi:sulfatase maturation enzyme AslB (radical SAM superfamily)